MVKSINEYLFKIIRKYIKIKLFIFIINYQSYIYIYISCISSEHLELY